jgi:hypothetical protein
MGGSLRGGSRIEAREAKILHVLEALGETAARLNRWELMLTINPVPVAGGTGFPLNALAMF